MSLADYRKWLTTRPGYDPDAIFTDEIFAPIAQVEVRRHLRRREGNPYYVWEAIDICHKHGLYFPPWIRAYLADCASRMTAPDATHGDLRKALPKIMGFNMKPGANLLRPDGPDDSGDDMLLAMRFVNEHVWLGRTREQALSNACVGLNPELLSMESKSLLARIRKVFGIERTPRTRDEWKAAIKPLFMSLQILELYLLALPLQIAETQSLS
jgi:hypothetical protein